jgi:hypothetical protein
MALLGGIFCFILLGYWEQSYLKVSGERLNHQLVRLESSLIRHDWETALKQLNRTEKTWKKTQKWWAVLTHHQEIDSVEQALTKTRESIIGKSYPDARMELGTLRHFLRHIAEREKFNLVNIF